MEMNVSRPDMKQGAALMLSQGVRTIILEPKRVRFTFSAICCLRQPGQVFAGGVKVEVFEMVKMISSF